MGDSRVGDLTVGEAGLRGGLGRSRSRTGEKVELIAGEIERMDSTFQRDGFVAAVVARFLELELKARIDWIATCLERHLPQDFRRAADVLLRSLPAPADPALSDGDFGDFIYAPYAEYVARHGPTVEDLEFSLTALREITTRFSAEFAIRPFLDSLPIKCWRRCWSGRRTSTTTCVGCAARARVPGSRGYGT